MDSKRIAVIAGIIGVLSVVVKTVPAVLLGGSFEQGVPGWLPTFGTIGATTLIYNFAIDVLGGLFMVVFATGVGYYVSQHLDLRYQYRQFFGAVVAGTTVPLGVAWAIGVGGFLLGVFSGFNLVVLTGLVLRLFATVSLPVIVAMFAGAAFAYFTKTDHSAPKPQTVNTDTTSVTR